MNYELITMNEPELATQALLRKKPEQTTGRSVSSK